jgi:membrane fusion protein (multidrug efflux system)
VQAYPDQTFTGEVLYIGPSVRSASRDLLVEAKVPNLDGKLRPGMFATSHLKLPDQPLPVVPKSALRQEDTTTHIFVVVDHRIQERIVQTGVERDGMVAILDGLRAGDVIIKEITPDIKDGATVN